MGILNDILGSLPDKDVIDVRIGLHWTAVAVESHGELHCGLASTLSDTTQNGIATDFDLEAMEDTTSCRASDFKPDLANEGG